MKCWFEVRYKLVPYAEMDFTTDSYKSEEPRESIELESVHDQHTSISSKSPETASP